MTQLSGDARVDKVLSRAAVRASRACFVLPLIVASSACSAAQAVSSSGGAAPQRESGSPQTRPAAGKIVTELDDAIFYVFQARNDDYWFGSNDRGVYRYDGKTLVNFTTDDGLASNQIRGIQDDAAGVVYVITYSGIHAFDGHALRTLSVSTTSAPTDWVLRPDDLWFVAGQDTGAVYRYDGELLHRLTFPPTAAGEAVIARYPRSEYPNAKFSPYDVYTIHEDRGGNKWFGTALLGACRYDGKSFAWLPDSELRNGSFGTRAIVEDKDGSFWFCTSMNRYVVELGDASAPSFKGVSGLREPSDPSRPLIDGIMSSVVDDAGVWWMATYGDGVWSYDGKAAKHYPVTDGGKPITLFAIHKDKHGTLWLGSHSFGALRFDGAAFKRFHF